jgi:hypothetical protein
VSDYDDSLLPQHRALLHASGISPEVAEQRRYRSESVKARLGELGFGAAQRRPGLLIPIWDAHGQIATYQLRPDSPREKDGRHLKYETPAGGRLVLDVPPAARPLLDDPGIPLFVTEGARKADAAVTRGLCCVALLGVWGWRGTNPKGGKTALPDWETIALNSRIVYLCFDSDVTYKPEVAKALKRLAGFLESLAARCEVIYLPSGPGATKVGLDDYLADGHAVDDLLRLAKPDLPVPREQAAVVERTTYRGPPIDLAALLNDIAAFYQRYVVMTIEQADALALHIAHTHTIRHFETTPYVHIRSAEKRSGKSTCLKLAQELVARPRPTLNISDAAVYRLIDSYPEQEPPTFVMDEVDRVFYSVKGGGQTRPELAGLLNGGFQRGPLGHVVRMVGEGSNQEAKEFRTFGPKILAGIRDLPDTVADRSIPITLKRKAPGETVAKFRTKWVRREAEPLRSRLKLWAASTATDVLGDAEPAMPPGLHDRQEDLWEPLLAIADLANGEWPQRARAAAQWTSHTSRDADADAESLGIRLLGDIQAVFADIAADVIATNDLIGALSQIEESPWSAWHNTNPISATKLASMLKPFGIKPRKRRSGTDTIRGYTRDAFTDAWSRYTTPANTSGTTAAGTTWNNRHSSTADEDSAGRNAGAPVPTTDPAPHHHGYADVPACSDAIRETQVDHDGDVAEAAFLAACENIFVATGMASWQPERPPCQYSEHRLADWRGPTGGLICGVCHPPPTAPAGR